VRAVETEARRREAQKALAEADSRELTLDPHRAAELEKILPLVQGTRGIMIGGVCREDNRRAIEQTLKLSTLVWEDTNGRESVYDFESLVAHPETRVVFLMIRFMRTGYGRVAELCRKYGKTLVRLPAGYGVNQVIHQLAEQMGGATQPTAAAPTAAPAATAAPAVTGKPAAVAAGQQGSAGSSDFGVGIEPAPSSAAESAPAPASAPESASAEHTSAPESSDGSEPPPSSTGDVPSHADTEAEPAGAVG
jgi:hypothetical protein